MNKVLAMAAIVAVQAQASIFEEDKDHKYIKDDPSSFMGVDRHFFNREIFEKEDMGVIKPVHHGPGDHDFIPAHAGHLHSWGGKSYHASDHTFGSDLGDEHHLRHKYGADHGFLDGHYGGTAHYFRK